MDVLTFIVKIIEATAWPAVALFVLWLGRARVGTLLDRVENFEGWGAKFKFGQRLDQVEKVIGAAADQTNATALSPQSPTGGEGEVLGRPGSSIQSPLDLALLKTAPAYVVLEAYSQVREAMRDALEQHGKQVRPGVPTLSLAERLKLPREDVEALREMRDLRNQAAHDPRMKITPSDALRYRDIADRLLKIIKRPPSASPGQH